MRRATLGLAAAAALGGLAGLAPVAAVAQDRAQESRGAGQPAELATLVADALLIDAEGRLTATGSVEAFYGTARLRAAAITYDPATERLQITGPITLVEGDGATIVLASAADLSTDMTEGLLEGARLVLDRQMQVAAQSIQRTQGRYTRAARVRASSCEVCAANPVPLWEIRATSVVHDEVERQLYFDNAQFRVIGIPVFWLPYLRAPDPTLDRSRGFLAPSIRTTSGLGTGIKLPYFIPIGQSRDLTVTPYVSTNVTRTVELRYRQAFRAGDIEFRGSLSRDDLEPGETRGAFFGTGSFDIGSDFRLNFGIEAVTDDAYISDYGLGDSDRLESFVEVTRTRRNDYVLGRLIHYDSLREGEDNSTLPTLIGDFTWVRRFAPAIIGGEGGLTFQTHSHLRTSDEETDANGDGIVDGRDVARATIAADWRRNWIADNGMILAALTELTADVYEVRQDPAYDDLELRVTPAVGAELRWPFLRPAPAGGGAAWVVEPVVQVAWSPGDSADDEVPNEDSVLVEFDEGNLFSLDRFPGADAHEAGLRANVGFTATRHAPRGASLAFALGRVVRTEDLGQFNSSTGLDGATSDWLLAAQYDGASGLTVTNRALFDDDFDVSRNELRLIWSAERYSVGSSFIWLEPDLAEQRPEATSQLAVDAAWDISADWAAQLETRYDFEADRAARAGLGLQYSTECVTLDLSLSRRFTSSTSVRATTDFDLAVVLNGFGSGNRGSARRACGG
ncbi:LPS-assembly protein LptD [Frigidibacter oleivorans]|uniref:LPS-assembly protein LptD n=1 Tax=Frigidibacter oleivorans TaxID=2487129 RepID=UPI000F8EBB98|nr:LPS assembly protein LptD [Frigidibacter oleivorans]